MRLDHAVAITIATQYIRHTPETYQIMCHWSPYDQQGQTTPEAVGSSTYRIPNVNDVIHWIT